MSYKMLPLTLATLLSGFVLLVLICSCRSTNPKSECYNKTGDPVCFFRDRPEFRWLTWQQAKDACKAFSATLPRIPNAAIEEIFETYLASVHQNDLSDMWMGGKNRGQGWKWVHDKPIDPISQPPYEDIHYTNWQPNVSSQSKYECMTIALGEAYKWKTSRCDAYFRFVCQTGPSVIRATSIKPTAATSTTATISITTTTTTTNTTELVTLNKSEGLPLSIVLAAALGSTFSTMTCVIIILIVIIIVKRENRKSKSAADLTHSYEDPQTPQEVQTSTDSTYQQLQVSFNAPYARLENNAAYFNVLPPYLELCPSSNYEYEGIDDVRNSEHRNQEL